MTNKDSAVTTKPRKRAPGGGRKPLGKFSGKTVTITTRVMPETKDGLNHARTLRDEETSLSQEIERRLRDSLAAEREQSTKYGHDAALRDLVHRCITSIEILTRNKSYQDRFTHEAIIHAVSILLTNFKPKSALSVPQSIRQMVENSDETIRASVQRLTTPEGVGEMVALSIISDIDLYGDEAPLDEKGRQYSDSFSFYPRVKRALKTSKGKRK